MIARVGELVMNFEIKGMELPPIALISGLASDISLWSLQVPSLAQNFMTICLDNRGSGKTDAPDIPYTIEMMANDTSKLLDLIGVDDANLIGFGMGGRIALEMALRRPSKVRGLVLCSTAPRATPSEIGALQSFRSAIAEGAGRAELARQDISWTLSPRYLEDRRMAEALVRVRMAMMSGTSDQALLRQIEAVLGYDAIPRLHEVRCPTLVIAGSKDRLVPPDYQRQMAEDIPEAGYLTLDAAHMVPTEAAKEFNESVLRFLVEKEA